MHSIPKGTKLKYKVQVQNLGFSEQEILMFNWCRVFHVYTDSNFELNKFFSPAMRLSSLIYDKTVKTSIIKLITPLFIICQMFGKSKVSVTIL